MNFGDGKMWFLERQELTIVKQFYSLQGQRITLCDVKLSDHVVLAEYGCEGDNGPC